ncbi:MAG: universal stress protein [Phenylobacterium sp.]
MSFAQQRVRAEALKTIQPAPAAPRYATLLVHAEPGLQASQRVEFAGRLARDLDAHLIGLTAETLSPFLSADPSLGFMPDERVVKLSAVLEDDLTQAEAAFRRDSAGADVETRRVIDFPAEALARASRAADLVIVSPKSGAPPALEADPGEVVVRAGKPVLIVPSHARRMRLETVVIAWKESRECRRAVAAAMPFLARADQVIVQAVCDAQLHEARRLEVDDVVEGLRRQGVNATARVTASKDGVVNELMRTLSGADADLLVMGAYGHTRVTELVFGGVTEHFLRRPACVVLMAH